MVDSSREAFEKWLKSQPLEVPTLERSSEWEYIVWDIEKMRRAWEASRSAADSRTEEYLRKLAWSEEDISAWKAWGK